jgi:hypothetical protein
MLRYHIASSHVFNYIYFSFIFGSKNNNIVQLSIVLNNEASVLESFFHMIDMVGR